MLQSIILTNSCGLWISMYDSKTIMQYFEIKHIHLTTQFLSATFIFTGLIV